MPRLSPAPNHRKCRGRPRPTHPDPADMTNTATPRGAPQTRVSPGSTSNTAHAPQNPARRGCGVPRTVSARSALRICVGRGVPRLCLFHPARHMDFECCSSGPASDQESGHAPTYATPWKTAPLFLSTAPNNPHPPPAMSTHNAYGPATQPMHQPQTAAWRASPALLPATPQYDAPMYPRRDPPKSR